MTVPLLPHAVTRRGRVQPNPDPIQPYALHDDDGTRLTAYDDFLTVMAGVVALPAWAAVIASHLLLWQQWLWATGQTRAEAEADHDRFLAWAGEHVFATTAESLSDTVLAFLDAEDIGYYREEFMYVDGWSPADVEDQDGCDSGRSSAVAFGGGL